MKGYGFITPQIDPDNYVFGAVGSLSTKELVPNGQWEEFLPTAELQRQYGLETMNCTAYGTLNCIETLMNRLFGDSYNYSERFTGIVAENTKQGNSPHKVAESIRKKGLILDELLPLNPHIDTWEEYYSSQPMSYSFLDKGQNWLNEYVFNHDWVFTGGTVDQKKKLLKYALKSSPLGVSVLAWQKRDGKYYKEENSIDNHWCTLYGYVEGDYWKVFDHYDDTFKQLEWDYDFGFAKRFVVEKKIPTTKQNWLIDLLKRIFSWT